ncbi:MAG TPA: AI-2E family transporter [Candidatus Eremiobacteraceae bacterium]|nr:AI-2E family transporter [Candidatus Eremiobacteraceae bacterium]
MGDDRLTRNLKVLGVVALSLALAAVAYLFLAKIKLVVIILIAATFIAYLLYPAVVWLQRRRFPRWAAITVVYIALAVLIGAGLAYIGPVVTDEAQRLTTDTPKLLAETRDAIVNANNNLLATIPESARQSAVTSLDNLVSQFQSVAADFAGQAVRFAASLAAFMTAVILVPLLAFYILLDIDRLRETIVGLFPQRHRERALAVLADIDSVVGGFVRGQIIVGAIVGGLVTVLLLIFRIKYALLIGVFAGVADLVPYVGAFAGAIPAVLLELFNAGPVWALILVGAFALLYELEGHIIAPAIVSQRVGLTPLVVIVAILIGAEVGGIGGMFLSVPIAGIIRVLTRRFMHPQVVVPTQPLAPIEEAVESTASAEDKPRIETATK